MSYSFPFPILVSFFFYSVTFILLTFVLPFPCLLPQLRGSSQSPSLPPSISCYLFLLFLSPSVFPVLFAGTPNSHQNFLPSPLAFLFPLSFRKRKILLSVFITCIFVNYWFCFSFTFLFLTITDFTFSVLKNIYFSLFYFCQSLSPCFPWLIFFFANYWFCFLFLLFNFCQLLILLSSFLSPLLIYTHFLSTNGIRRFSFSSSISFMHFISLFFFHPQSRSSLIFPLASYPRRSRSLLKSLYLWSLIVTHLPFLLSLSFTFSLSFLLHSFSL